MAKVNINFIGPWRLFLGVRTVTAEVNNIDEVRDYVETNYVPVYNKKLRAKGVKKSNLSGIAATSCLMAGI